jgi:hypothetical protein
VRACVPVLALALASLACITQEYRVEFNPAANGAGVVYLSITYPQDLMKAGLTDPTRVLTQLEAEGWQQASWSEPDGDH